MAEKNAPFFSRLIETGQFRVDDKGHATLFGEFLFMMPPKVIVRLQDDLQEELGEERMQEMMMDLGSYQVRQALERYKDRYEFEDMPKEDFLEFMHNVIRIIGWGRFDVRSLDAEAKTFEAVMEHPTLPIVYRKKLDRTADTPICYFLGGMLRQGFTALFEEEMTVEEVHCAAVDGKLCRFEGSPTA